MSCISPLYSYRTCRFCLVVVYTASEDDGLAIFQNLSSEALIFCCIYVMFVMFEYDKNILFKTMIDKADAAR